MGRVLLIGVLLLCGVVEGALKWETDYNYALEKSRMQERPLLLFFSGSDWSGWSMKLKKEVLDSPLFAEKVGEQFVCFEVDFPLHSRLPNEQAALNAQLKEEWDVADYPRIVLVDPEGGQIARFGYAGEEPAFFADDLLVTVEQSEKLKGALVRLSSSTSAELETFYKLAQELQRPEAAQKILEVGIKTKQPLFFLLEKYRLLVEEGKGLGTEALSVRRALQKADPHNIHGVHYTLALLDFQERASQETLSKETIRPLEEYLAQFGETDPANVWRVEMMIAQFYFDYDERDTALQHAEMAYRTAPEAMQEEIGHSVDYIKKHISHTAQN